MRAAAGSPEGRRSLQGLIGPATVLGSGQPATATQSSAPGRWVRVAPPYPPGRQELPRNVARVPIRRGTDVIGDLRVHWASRAAIGSQQARLLDTVAGQVAVATERDRLRARATEAEVLRRTSELKSALLDAVSHDLRTPLAAIIAATEACSRTTSSGSRTSVASSSRRSSRSRTGSTGSSATCSISAASRAACWCPRASGTTPRSCFASRSSGLRAATREHRLAADLPDEMEPVLLDPVEIDQVVANLVENAVKYSPAGGEIRVSCRRGRRRAARLGRRQRAGRAERGPAAPVRAVLPGAFRATPFAGSGLGLAVARGLVDAHGGRIWAENLNGRGARFTFAIPPHPDARGAGTVSPGDGARILDRRGRSRGPSDRGTEPRVTRVPHRGGRDRRGCAA